MNDNEPAAAESPDSLTTPTRRGIPLAAAFHRAATANPNRAAARLAAMFHPVTTAAPGTPSVVVSPPKDMVIRRRQRVLTRSVAFRARRRLIDGRFTRRDREAAQQARRPRQPREARLLALMEAALSGPAGDGFRKVFADFAKAVASVVAPLQETMREIAQMVLPPGLRVFAQMQERLQRSVRVPMPGPLRRVQEQIAAYARPTFRVPQRIRDAVTGTSDWLMGSFRHTREWASGFMTYQAKLRQQFSSMVGSWSWKLPDLTEIVRPITDTITKIIRGFEWPGGSAMTKTIVEWAVRAVFWAAVRTREAIIHEENSEEIVREFMLAFLDLFPKGRPHVEAAKEALLEDAWLKAEPKDVKKVLLKRIRDLHRNHRMVSDTELRHRRVVSLNAPLSPADSDSDMVLTLVEALADPDSVEDFVLNLPEFRDPRIDRVLNKLKPGEREVADLYAGHDDMTWDLAAAAAGQPPAFGERVRRKLIRLGDQFDSRQARELHIPSTTKPRTRPAFS
ncbi:hypothetical protein ACTOB_003718 [Actinoplanes oblitus]|uniref:Uncharacterized protein n=1 Tax=Actinoplanes oblitus TaxID=3040509 RepID=A0ABY8WQ87_9ACTN|nr:hypothetical protein [Actinoplanes oblitus]WIN00042.1 hypothetical protein ACTOB_003718 [Actinoplanes oblitus]